MSIDLQGQGSGLGPQMGGFAPTPAEALMAQQRMQSGMQLYQYAAYTDPAARAAQGLAAMAITGNGRDAGKLLHESATGQFLKDSSAVLAARGLLGGGSPVQMMYGVQQAMANSGVRLSGPGGVQDQYFGAGFVTDQLSRGVFDRMRSNFFDRVTGMPISSRAAGLDKTQMGQLMNMASQRGAFSGMNMGELKYYEDRKSINKDLAEARAKGDTELARELEQIEPGQYAFKANRQSMDKINSFMEDTAGMLKDMREVFGDLPVEELVMQAEALTGSDFAGPGAIGHMRSRISRLNNLAKAYGKNPQAMAAYSMQVAGGTANQMAMMYGGDPSQYRGVSSHIAMEALNTSVPAYEQSLANRRAFEGIGGYMPGFTQEQVTADTAYSLSRVLGEKGYMDAALEAEFYIQNGTASQPGKLKDIMSELKSASDPKSIRAIRKRLMDEMKNQGLSPGAATKTLGVGGMMELMGPEGQRAAVDLASANNQARGLGVVKSLSDVTGLGGTDASGAALFSLFNELGGEGIADVAKAIGPDGSIDAGAIQSMLEKNGDINLTYGQIADKLGTIGVKSGDQLASAFQVFNYQNKDFISSRTKRKSEKMQMQNWIADNALGSAGLTKEGLMTSVMKGLYGGGDFDKNAIMSFLEMEGEGGVQIFAFNEAEDALSLDATSAEKLAKVMGPGFMESMGAKSPEKLAAILGSKEGFAKMQEYMDSEGTVFTTGPDGLKIAEKDAIERAEKKLTLDAEVEHYQTLTGFNSDMLEKGLGGNEKSRGIVKQGALDALTSKAGAAHLTELANSAFSKGAGKELEALKFANKESRGRIADALKAEENRLMEAGGEKNIKQAHKLRAVGNELSQTKDKFLGILELQMGNTLNMKLFEGQ